MNGLTLFERDTAERDFSGSAKDVYAQLLFTLMVHLGDELYPLLEKAEKENKKLSVLETKDGFAFDEYTVEDVVFI